MSSLIPLYNTIQETLNFIDNPDWVKAFRCQCKRALASNNRDELKFVQNCLERFLNPSSLPISAPREVIDLDKDEPTFRNIILSCLKTFCSEYDAIPNLSEYFDMGQIEGPKSSDAADATNTTVDDEEANINRALANSKRKKKFTTFHIDSILKKGVCIVYAGPQAGKSSFIKTRAVYSLLEGYSVFIILRNLKGDLNQLENHIQEMNGIIKAHLDAYGIVERPFEITVIKGEKLTSEKNKELLTHSLQGKYPRIFLCLGNEAQLQRLVIATENATDFKYVMFIDECDYVDYGKNITGEFCSTAQKLSILKKHAYQTFAVTATPLDCIFSEAELKSMNCFNLKPKEGYRGFADFQVNFLSQQPEVYALNQEASFEDILSNDLNLAPFLETICNNEPETGPKYNELVPTICLIKNTRFISNQVNLAKGINTRFPSQFVTVVYNGSGSLIYYNDMPNEIQIKNQTVTKGEFTEVDIADVLQYFYDNGGATKFPRIIIIAGDLAGRSISYVNRNHKWHTTDMYYIPSQSATIPDMIQSAGRLCGVNQGLGHLILHTTKKVADALYNGYHFTDEVILRAMVAPILEGSDTEESLGNRILKVKMNKKKLPVNRTLTSKVKLNKGSFNLVNGDDDGLSLNSYKYKEIISQVVTIARERNERETQASLTREIPQDEFYRLTQTMFLKWSKGDNKISNFMRGLDPEKIYTKTELQEYMKNCNINTIFLLIKNKIGKSNGYGMIMKKLDNNRYQLYPELREAFYRYF